MTSIPEALADAPISTKLIWADLERDGPLRPSELTRRLRITESTVAGALNTLREKGMVASRPSPVDARRTLYFIDVDREES